MRSWLFCLFAAAATAATAPTVSEVAGRYYLQHFHEVGSELLLKPDGEFQFILSYGAADWWAKGSWHLQDGAVVLNSADENDPPPFRLVRSAAGKSGGVCIRVVGPNGRGVGNVDVSLQTDKGTAQAKTDSSGVAHFGKKNAPQKAVFRVRAYDLETEPIALNPEQHDFTFEINSRAITELRFTEQRLSLSGRILTMHYWGPDQDMDYVKGQ